MSVRIALCCLICRMSVSGAELYVFATERRERASTSRWRGSCVFFFCKNRDSGPAVVAPQAREAAGWSLKIFAKNRKGKDKLK